MAELIRDNLKNLIEVSHKEDDNFNLSVSIKVQTVKGNSVTVELSVDDTLALIKMIKDNLYGNI